MIPYTFTQRRGISDWLARFPGTAGTITTIPAGFKHTFVMRAGTKGGVTATIGEWGDMLQAYYKSWKLVDITLTNIGYVRTHKNKPLPSPTPRPPFGLLGTTRSALVGCAPWGYAPCPRNIN